MKRAARITTIITAIFLMAIVTIDASAQFRYRLSEREVREIGYRNGYQYGYREGRQDRRMRNGFDFRNDRAYRYGLFGYRDEYRHDGNYRDGFRAGFANGYREGYNSFSWWGRNRDDDSRCNDRNDDWWRRDNR